MGKTAFVLSMARNAAIDHGEPVAVFSLEMSALQLVMRLISQLNLGMQKLLLKKAKNGQFLREKL